LAVGLAGTFAIVWGCECGKRERVAVESQETVRSRTVTRFLALQPGMPYEEFARDFGEADANRGSGVFVLEYTLEPAGYALVGFGPDFRVRSVYVAYHVPVGKVTSSSGDVDSPEAAAKLVQDRERRAGEQARRLPPEAFVQIHTGAEVGGLATSLGPPAFQVLAEGRENLEYLLAPHGLATIRLQADRRIDSVHLVWWAGDER
jgi:hypothetical protein